MDFLKKFWPFSFNTEDVKQLVIKAIIYVVVGAVFGALIAVANLLLKDVPALPIILNLVSYLAELYVTAGLVFLFLSYFKVLKD